MRYYFIFIVEHINIILWFNKTQEKDKDEQITSLVENIKWQMSIDRKTTPLKSLQGLIWQKGYENGNIKGQ